MAAEPPLGSTPRQQRGIDARRRVYEAAVERFATDGVGSARVEDVVGDAGVSWGTFFRYFPRKEDVLLEAAVRHFHDRLLPAIEADLAGTSVTSFDLARSLVTSLLLPSEHPPVLHGEIVRETTERRVRFGAMVGRDEEPVLGLGARIVARGQGRGEVRSDLPAPLLAGVLLTGTIFTTLFGYYDPLRRDPSRTDLPDPAVLVENAFGIGWRGIEAGGAP